MNLFHKICFRINKIKANSRFSGQKTYSQAGEDIIVNNLFSLMGISAPSYLDIGANDPFKLSNTFYFYKKGSCGINIEANPDLIHKFNRFRKKDINLNIGISDKEEVLNFYIMQDNTMSTFSSIEMNGLLQAGHKLKEVLPVQLMTVQQVLDKYNNGIFPDFLSVDVEGMDFKILRTIDFEKTAPKVICVEAVEYSPYGRGNRKQDLIDFLQQQGYYEYANTHFNVIMVQKNIWFSKHGI